MSTVRYRRVKHAPPEDVIETDIPPLSSGSMKIVWFMILCLISLILLLLILTGFTTEEKRYGLSIHMFFYSPSILCCPVIQFTILCLIHCLFLWLIQCLFSELTRCLLSELIHCLLSDLIHFNISVQQARQLFLQSSMVHFPIRLCQYQRLLKQLNAVHL